MSERSNDLLRTHGEDFKFSLDFGHGLEFDHTSNHGENFRLRTSVDNVTSREATLEVYSYLQSLGAVHHYAKIKIGYPALIDTATGKRYNSFVSSLDEVPFGAVGVEFEVMRLVDKRDLKHDKDMAEMRGDSLYGRMRPGDWTHGHWSEQEAIDAAVKFFKEHFVPGWKLVDQHWHENEPERKIYAQT